MDGKAGTVSHGSNYLLLRHEKIGKNKQINNMDAKGKYCRESVGGAGGEFDVVED